MRCAASAMLSVLLAACLPGAETEVDLAAVLERHTEARGGAEAIEGVETLAVELEITEPEFTVTGKYVATRNCHMRIDIYDGAQRVFTEALGPDGGWQMRDDGVPVALSPEGEEALRRGITGNIYGLHELVGLGFQLSLVGLAERGGQRVWEIEQVAPDGSSKHVFVNTGTYLISSEVATGALHPDVDPTKTRQETFYSHYAASGDVLFADSVEKVDITTGEVIQTTVVTSRSVNGPVDASHFLRPAPGE